MGIIEGSNTKKMPLRHENRRNSKLAESTMLPLKSPNNERKNAKKLSLKKSAAESQNPKDTPTKIGHNMDQRPLNNNEIFSEKEPSLKNAFKEGNLAMMSNPVGEKNCFANVIIQILFHSPDFREQFLESFKSFKNNHILEPNPLSELNVKLIII